MFQWMTPHLIVYEQPQIRVRGAKTNKQTKKDTRLIRVREEKGAIVCGKMIKIQYSCIKLSKN